MIGKCVILISGGLDSATVLALAAKQGYEIHAISFKYGQRHTVELEAVKRIIADYPVKSHRIIEINLRDFGGSALTDEIDVPSYTGTSALPSEVPITYVPARNTIFLSYALALAEVTEANEIFIGVHSSDHANYPDCRPEFIESFENMANKATSYYSGGNKIKISAPLLHLTKADIVKLGTDLGVDYGKTISCYTPNDKAQSCGFCLACIVRKDAFSKNNLPDPTVYCNNNT